MDELQARGKALPVVNRAERYRQFKLDRMKRNWFKNAFNTVKNAVVGTANKVGNALSGVGNSMSDFFSGVGNTVSDFASGAYKSIAAALSGTANDVNAALERPPSDQVSLLAKAYDAVSSKVTELKAIVASKTGPAKEAAVKLLNLATAQLDDISSKFWTAWNAQRRK
ncbi:uncharacterized protein LOC127854011 isoform X2 [Dreissena polymorpha]|nr:uncharacterized protein LOC127854011 isoform X2 [Dreissena polymorpha]